MPEGPEPRGVAPRRVLWSAFGVSLAVHALAVLLYPAIARELRTGAAPFSFSSESARVVGIEVLRIVEVDQLEDAERPEEPREIDDLDAPAVTVEGPRLDERPSAELPVPGLTPSERLQPRLTDRRLWGPPPPQYRELTLEQREELLVAGRLQAWNDSVAAAVAADAAWKDWTFTDGDGGRWGVSEGQLHLGSITIPLPFAFDAPPGQRDYMRQFEEIARQGANAQVQQTVRERMEAIRARRDRERASARAAADSAGTSR